MATADMKIKIEVVDEASPVLDELSAKAYEIADAMKKAVEGRDPANNALKAVIDTDTEYRVANYIVLFGGRDLEGTLTPHKNRDGSAGEFFTKATTFDSPYTSTGHLLIDMEHGRAQKMYGPSAPGRDDIFGVVDWKSAQIDDNGIWVERALNRQSKYLKFVKTLITERALGSSTEAIPDQVEKNANGEITKWPIRRDTFTFTPMEPRMLTENVIQAAKALGLQIADEPEPEAQPEADVEALAVEAAKAEAAQTQLELSLLLLEA